MGTQGGRALAIQRGEGAKTDGNEPRRDVAIGWARREVAIGWARREVAVAYTVKRLGNRIEGLVDNRESRASWASRWQELSGERGSLSQGSQASLKTLGTQESQSRVFLRVFAEGWNLFGLLYGSTGLLYYETSPKYRKKIG